MEEVLTVLENEEKLPGKYKNHFLKGDYNGHQEYHIEKNLLLIYRIENNILYLIRFGNHDDLLSK